MRPFSRERQVVRVEDAGRIGLAAENARTASRSPPM